MSCQQKIDKAITVGIIPYKDFDNKKIKELNKTIKDYYQVTTKILPNQELPRQAFIDIKSPRYRADSIIAVQRRKNKDLDYIIGFTHKDISITKRDNNGNIRKPVYRYNDFGIMGLAYCPGNSCVVSDFRLKHENNEIQFGRFKKVTIHELGHNFGLPHCKDKKCVMTDAVESIKTIDNANPDLCTKCKKKLNIQKSI